MVTYLDPAARIARTTEDIACSNLLCSGISGQLEHPAVETHTDELGRPVAIVTAEGSSLFHYRTQQKPVVHGGVIEAVDVDAVLGRNAKGDLTLRSLDGDRVMAVEECSNTHSLANPLAGESCAAASGPNRTLYGYHVNGQLEVIYDVKAVAGAGGAAHQLVYHYDSAGQVTRIEDPDAGVSVNWYDSVGNLMLTQNAREQMRAFHHDELHRLTAIDTNGDETGEYTVTYGSARLQRSSETGPLGTIINYFYDPYGRLMQEDAATGPASPPAPAADRVTVGATYQYDLLGRPTYVKPSWVNLMGIRYFYQGAFLKKVCRTSLTDPDCSLASVPIIEGVTYDDLGRRRQVAMPPGVREYTYTDTTNPLDRKRHLARDAFKVGSTEKVATAYTAYDA